MASAAIAGFFIVAIAGGVGFGVASADSSDDLARSGAFGFDEATHIATLAVAADSDGKSRVDMGTSGQQILGKASARDISAGLSMMGQQGASERAHALALERVKAQEQAKAKEQARAASPDPEMRPAPVEPLEEYDLAVVDWSVGKKAFLEEWTKRIDAYLAGTPLEGCGSTFAQAAWDNGVDPRWSPAISNTESGNGAHCFLLNNAWGWGNDSWPDWDTAIHAHVAGLATVFGYSLTFDAAQSYCPPNCYHWYNNTLKQMRLI